MQTIQHRLQKMFVALLGLVLLLVPVSSQAMTIITAEDEYDNIVISEETKDDIYAFTANDLRLTKALDGDLWGLADYVGISSAISGDLVMFAITSAVVDAEVKDDIRLASLKTVEINNTVNGDAIVFAKQVKIGPEAVINGQLFVVGGTLELAGTVNGDAYAFVDEFDFYGKINGEAKVSFERLTSLQAGTVAGTFNYSGALTEAQLTEKISANNFEIDTKNEMTPTAAGKHAKAGFDFGSSLLFLIVNLVLGLVFVLAVPNFLPNITNTLKAKPLPSLGIGLATIFGIPLASILIMISVVGIKISLLMLTKFIGFILVAKVLAGFSIGYFIFKTPKELTRMEAFGVLALGLTIIELLSLIPVVGGLLKFVAYILVIGAAQIWGFEVMKKLRKDKLV
ncbi:hypothetical protein KA036_01110 [Candidatus Gracilibacteria bacterium]|jgi:hypothetical protein|nr:hypothetical protein [Candidatus Gracilibacteria bacterium]